MREFGWEGDARRQQLWISVKNWNYKAFISNPKYLPRTLFQWEGVVSRGSDTLIGVDVAAGIECIGDSSDHNICGTLQFINEGELMESGESIDELSSNEESKPLLGLTLFANQESIDMLLKMFAATFACKSQSGLGVEIYLQNSESNTPGFWQKAWQQVDIDVVNYGIYSGGSLIGK